MRRAAGRWVVLLCALLLLGGCATSSDDPGPATKAPVAKSSQKPKAGSTPSPTEISAEEAGAHYLDLAEPVNALLDPWYAAYDAGDWQSLKEQAGPYADTLRTFADGLSAAEWPPEAQTTVDRMIAEVAAQIIAFIDISEADGDEAIVAALNEFPAPTSTAQELRTILGLEDVPTV